MTASWMVYCAGTSTLFGLVAWALEKALASHGKALRGAWVVGILGSLSLPVALAFSAALGPSSGPVAPRLAPLDVPAIQLPLARLAENGAISADVDYPLLLLWIGSSAALLILLLLSEVDLLRQRRKWRRTTIDGVPVLVSDDVGPAVVGLLRSEIVLPEWACRANAAPRSMILRHELEHVRGKDPLLVAFSLSVLALGPWNLALWWMHWRLRQAVEIDCDRRVLRRGGDPRAYGMLLLEVAQCTPRPWLVGAALAHTSSSLRRRVHYMMDSTRKRSVAGVLGFAAVATMAALVACEVPGPSAGVPATLTAAGEKGEISVVALGGGKYRFQDNSSVVTAAELDAALLERARSQEGRRVINVLVHRDIPRQGRGYEAVVLTNAAARAGFAAARGIDEYSEQDPAAGTDLPEMELEVPPQGSTQEDTVALPSRN